MFNHILAPLDGSSLAECVLAHVVAFAQTFGSQITLLHVMESTQDGHRLHPIDPLDWQIAKAERQAALDRLVAWLRDLNLDVTSVVLEGQAAKSIIAYAQSYDVDLITISSHGQSGLTGWNVGGVSQKVIVHGRTSTLVVRAYRPCLDSETAFRYRRILVPLDGSRRSECVLAAATALTRAHAAQLLLVHVVHKPEMPRLAPPMQEDLDLVDRLVKRNRQEAANYLAQIQAQILCDDVETRLLVSDEVAFSLHNLVEEEGVDLVVMAAHGYSAQRKWPHGSLTTSFIAYGNTPLLFVQDMPHHEILPTTAEAAAVEHKGH